MKINRSFTKVFGGFVVAAILSAPLGAQVPTGTPPTPAPMGQRRAELEQVFRERTAQVVKRQLKLDDAQMARLQTANQEFAKQRTALVAQERTTRQALRTELMAGDAANQQKVGTLLDQMMKFQRQRLDLQENEQRELGKILTPVQRAKYLGLQNQLRQRMMELRSRGGPGMGRPQGPMGMQRRRPMARPLGRFR
jgi:periplasmic protein CpxP/Spy